MSTRFIAHEFTEFALSLYKQNISPDLSKFLTKLLIDKIGLILGGSQFPWSQATYQATTQFPAIGRAKVAYFGDLLSPEQTAFINASFGHAQDFDDTHVLAITHPGAVVIPTAFAIANQVGANMSKVLAAIAAGVEIMVRIAYAIPSCHAKGFHTPTVAGPFAAAITAGLLLELNQQECVNAFSIAGSFSGGLWEYTQTGGTAKRMHCAIAASAGIKAAYLAAQGLSGPSSIFEGKFGVCQVFDNGTHMPRLTKHLGEKYLLTDTSFKYYNCPFSIHAALEALLDICKCYQLRPEDIQKIEVGTSRFVLNHVGKIRHPKNLMEAQFSMVFTLALALLQGPPKMFTYKEEVLHNPDVQLLASKIHLYEDVIATKEQSRNMGSIVKVISHSQQRHEKRVKYPKGTSQNPLSMEEIEQKFEDSTSLILSKGETKQLLATIKNLDALNKTEEITDKWDLHRDSAPLIHIHEAPALNESEATAISAEIKNAD
nr:hypothetical protein [Legionella jordanis]